MQHLKKARKRKHLREILDRYNSIRILIFLYFTCFIRQIFRILKKDLFQLCCICSQYQLDSKSQSYSHSVPGLYVQSVSPSHSVSPGISQTVLQTESVLGLVNLPKLYREAVKKNSKAVIMIIPNRGEGGVRGW